MTLARLAVALAAATLFVTSVLSKEGDHKIHIKGIQCNHSDKFLFPNMTCFARSYSRTFCGMNIAAYATKPLYDIQVEHFFFVFVSVSVLLNVFR